MKVWITKYALTQGIYSVNAEVDGKYAKGKTPKGYHFFTTDFAKSEAEAISIAEKMRDRKIASLNKQIAKLSAMKFGA